MPEWLRNEPDELARLAHFEIVNCDFILPGVAVKRRGRIILFLPDGEGLRQRDRLAYLPNDSDHRETAFGKDTGRNREAQAAGVALSGDYYTRANILGSGAREVCAAWRQ